MNPRARVHHRLFFDPRAWWIGFDPPITFVVGLSFELWSIDVYLSLGVFGVGLGFGMFEDAGKTPGA